MKRVGRYFAAADPAERFRAFVPAAPQDACWPWQGTIRPDGYGRFYRSGNNPEPAHRASWEFHNGPIPDGLCVLHRCDNKPCVNPSHLFLGTRTDNNRDKVEKGRAKPPHQNKTHCPSGHPYAGDNLGMYKGARVCRTCANTRTRARYRRNHPIVKHTTRKPGTFVLDRRKAT